jgi:hypothetical protein
MRSGPVAEVQYVSSSIDSLRELSLNSWQLLAGLAIVIGIPFPIWIYYKGEAFRLSSKVQL